MMSQFEVPIERMTPTPEELFICLANGLIIEAKKAMDKVTGKHPSEGDVVELIEKAIDFLCRAKAGIMAYQKGEGR